MKNIYLVQVDVTSGADVKVVYLPYATGLLAATAWKDDAVKNNYNFGRFIFTREDIDKVVQSLEEPYLVGFSNYCWNAEYNRLLAKKIKEIYPDCIILFGGHDIPDNKDFLREHGSVDILMHGEGEYGFRDLLKALLTGDISCVPNITYRDGAEIVRTENAPPPQELDFPSPYLDGWYDDIIDNSDGISFNAILETSRGCPNQCAYCDWGLLKSKTRLFPLERITAEINWMSEKKIAFIWGADANFGMFKRDVDIVKVLVAVKNKNGFPERMRMNYSKTNYENVFQISKMLRDCDFDRIGATLSFQSMSPVVLKNIGRTNMPFDFFMQLISKYRTEKIKTYSELILGLPGETYQSFIDGLAKLLELGQHLVFEVYGCILLPNSQLGQPETIKKFGIKTVKAEMVRGHCTEESISIPEYNTIIVETNTLSRKEWVRATVFHQFVKGMHANGLVRAFAIYLYFECGIRYQDFYDAFLSYTMQHEEIMLYKRISDLFVKADKISKGEKYEKLTFDPCGDFIWNEHEYFVMYMLSEFDKFYEEITPFLRQYNFPDDVFDDILRYQKAVIRRPDNPEDDIELTYDLDDYYSSVYINEKKPLVKRHNLLHLKDSDPMFNWDDFGKYVIWYGNMGWKSYKDSITKELL